MSAFVVGNDHIDALVTAAVDDEMSWYHDGEQHFTSYETADEVGQMLLGENVKSVNARYREHEFPEVYEFHRTRKLSPVVILKAIRCLDYQSCEHPGWETSAAHTFLEYLTVSMIHELAGYDEAPWELTAKDLGRKDAA